MNLNMYLRRITRYLTRNYFDTEEQIVPIMAYTAGKTPLSIEEFLNVLLRIQIDYQGSAFTVLYLLSKDSEGLDILTDLLLEPGFKEQLIADRDLLLSLFLRRTDDPDENMTVFAWFTLRKEGVQLLKALLDDTRFKTNFFSHQYFLSTMLMPWVSDEGEITSIFEQLVADQDSLYLLQSWVSFPEFMMSISGSVQSRNQFCRALLRGKNEDVDTVESDYPLAILLTTLIGRGIIKTLVENKAIRLGLLHSLKIVSLDWLLDTDAGFFLFSQLIYYNRLQPLRSDEPLFKHPHIKQLITMGKLEADLFLFIYATGPSDHEFCEQLDDLALSPWATNTRGYSLADVISASSLDDETKARRLAFIDDALVRYPRQVSDTCLLVHLNNLGAIHTGAPSDALPPELPSAVVAAYAIDGLEAVIIQSFQQHLQWIADQPALEAYHAVFQVLSDNESIRTASDYPAVLCQLKAVCACMNYYVLHSLPIPTPYPEWPEAFSLCDEGVLTALGEMFNEFSNQPALASYLQQVQSDTTARYHYLFSTPDVFEVHIPKQGIQAELGLLGTLPRYDGFALNWSCAQRRWSAQMMMDHFIKPDPWIDCMTSSLDIDVEQFASTQSTVKRTRRASVIADFTPEIQRLFEEKYRLYSRSPLFKKPFDLRQFYAFIGDLPEDDKRLGTMVVLRADLLQVLKEKALAYWVEQQVITSPESIQQQNELLWHLLTTSLEDMSLDEYEALECLISSCSKAVDGLAFIKYCIESHQSRLTELQVDNFFKSSRQMESIFSLFVTNPLYCEWLFGFRIHMTIDEEQESQTIEFKTEDSNHQCLIDALWASGKIPIELESMLEQPGTLFFWLYYFKDDDARSELYQAVLECVSDQSHGFLIYNALAPLLYDMQKDDSEGLLEQPLIRVFLLNRMDEQLKARKEAFWKTASLCVGLNPVLDIIPKLKTNDWLLSTLIYPENKAALAYLVNDDLELLRLVRALEERHRSHRGHLPLRFFSSIEELTDVDSDDDLEFGI